MGSDDDIGARASRYAARHDLSLGPPLGHGRDGDVHSTIGGAGGPTALKLFAREPAYGRERDCYRRLRAHGVSDVQGHHVPQLLASDDELPAIEMTIVVPPYLLDFAGAHLDEAPEFPDHVMEEWQREKQDQFGDRWPAVQLLLATLSGSLGIHLVDVNPGNITFSEGEDASPSPREPRPHCRAPDLTS